MTVATGQIPRVFEPHGRQPCPANRLETGAVCCADVVGPFVYLADTWRVADIVDLQFWRDG